MNKIHIEDNFYTAAHLISKGFIIEDMPRNGLGKQYYHFVNSELLQKAKEDLFINGELRTYIEGVIKLRNMVKEDNKKNNYMSNGYRELLVKMQV